MRSLNALATMVAVLLVGALVSEPAFAYRGGGHSGRGGGVAVAGGGAFVRPGGVVVAGGGGKVFVGSRVVVGVGVGFPAYWGARWYSPYPVYPYYAPYYYPYYYPPAYYPSGPTTYIEQGSGEAVPQQQAPEHWWYYCAESKMYYPYAKECPGGWQRVSPQPPSPN